MSDNYNRLSDMCNNKITTMVTSFTPWLAHLQSRLQGLLQQPTCTAGTLETTLEAAGKDLLRALLEPALQALADTVAPNCPTCQQALCLEARGKPRTITTVFGSARFVRDYGWCRHCQQWCY